MTQRSAGDAYQTGVNLRMASLVAAGALAAAGTLVGPVGCSSSSSDEPPPATADASPDGLVLPPPPPPCDRAKNFGTPKPVPGLPTQTKASAGKLTDDERTIVYDDGAHLVAASRPDTASPFETKPWMGVANSSSSSDFTPWIRGDGKELLFVSNRNGGTFDLFRATRDDPQAPFSTAQSALKLPAGSLSGPLLRDGRELWFHIDSSGKGDIARAPVSGDGTVGAADPVAELNDPSALDSSPVVTSDGRTIFFASQRTGSEDSDVWTATRASDTVAFSTPTRVPGVNSRFIDAPTWISNDGCRLYLTSGRPVDNEPDASSSGELHVFVAERPQ